MSNVLPPKEQKRVWVFYRTRLILVGSMALSIIALIVFIALMPSYFYLVHNEPIVDSAAKASAQVRKTEREEAFKIQAQLAILQPIVASTSSVMDMIQRAIDGKPSGIAIDHISYKAEASQNTIIFSGTSKSRESTNALKKELEAKGIYKSVTVPVSDLIGVSGNKFTVTLVSKNP